MSVQEIMHARLEWMSKPRPDDPPRLARLRAMMRDQRIMAHVVANVDQWPPLTEEQRSELAGLLHPPRRDHTRRRKPPKRRRAGPGGDRTSGG